MLVGNKGDRTHDRAVARDEGARLAQTLGFGFVETSAKMASNVEHAFAEMVRALRLKRPERWRRVVTHKQRPLCTCSVM